MALKKSQDRTVVYDRRFQKEELQPDGNFSALPRSTFPVNAPETGVGSL